MRVLKNSHLARMYGVHPSTISNWIEGAKAGRNRLQVAEHKDKWQILDTANNQLIMEELAGDGKKHNSRVIKKTITPKPEFYSIFSKKQISEIIVSLDSWHEIPLKFIYLDQGAYYWNDYSIRSFNEKIANTVTNTEDMLDTSFYLFLKQLSEGETVNIVDIGVGNATTMKRFTQRVLAHKILNKYIAVDFSPEILKIGTENLRSWFGNDFPIETHVRDVSVDSIEEILFYSSRDSKAKDKVKNLVFFLGGTLANQRDKQKTLLNLKNSISKYDILTIDESLDTNKAKSYFDLFSGPSEQTYKTGPQVKWIPDIMNLTEDLYDAEMLYDEKDQTRKISVVLKYALDIKFKDENKDLESTISFSKGDKIGVYRHRHNSLPNVISNFYESGLSVVGVVTPRDQTQVLVLSQLPTD